MNDPARSPARLIAGALATLLLVIATVLLGMVLGGLFVKFFVPKTGMGWDQIADALGGLMVGALAGLVAGVLLARSLAPMRRVQVAAGAVLTVALCTGVLRMLRVEPVEHPVTVRQSFKPWFKFKVRVGNSQELLQAVAPGDEPIAFVEASMFSAVPDLKYEGWRASAGPCTVTPSHDELTSIEPLVSAAVAEAQAGHCRTADEGDLRVVFVWSRDNARGNTTVEAACLSQRPALLALVDRVNELAVQACPVAL